MQLADIYGQTAASSSVHTGSTNSSVLLYGATNVRGLFFFNHSAASMFLKFGSGASTTNFSVKLGSGSYYEIPYPIHTGSYTATWDAAGGSVIVTYL